MTRHEKFRFRSLDELADRAASLGVEIPLSTDLTPLARPLRIGPCETPNRLAVHPMEGCDGTADGRPGELTIRRYERFARGGAGLLWYEATAVVPEARANPRQLLLTADTAPAFERMLERAREVAGEARGHRPVAVLQLTHSGRYSRPVDRRAPIIAFHDPYLDPTTGVTPDQEPVTDDYLEALEERFAAAAALAYQVGFDGVDVKSCHRYLGSELLAGHTRPGRYGGSFENRTRFLLDVVDRIRRRLPPERFVAVRLNVYDGHPYPYGFGVDPDDVGRPDLLEPIRLARLLAERGVALVNVTAGNPYYSPHVNRPYDLPIHGGYVPPEHPLVGVARIVGLSRQVRRAVPGLAIVGTGFSWLRHFLGYAMAGAVGQGWCDLAGLGRGAFAHPDFARDLLETGRLDPKKVCATCSRCTQIMRDGGMTGCVLRDRDVYLPIYQAGRQLTGAR